MDMGHFESGQIDQLSQRSAWKTEHNNICMYVTFPDGLTEAFVKCCAVNVSIDSEPV